MRAAMPTPLRSSTTRPGIVGCAVADPGRTDSRTGTVTQRNAARIVPSTRVSCGSGWKAPDAAPAASVPYAGTTRIRFKGCDLSPAIGGTPLRRWLSFTVTQAARKVKPGWPLPARQAAERAQSHRAGGAGAASGGGQLLDSRALGGSRSWSRPRDHFRGAATTGGMPASATALLNAATSTSTTAFTRASTASSWPFNSL